MPTYEYVCTSCKNLWEEVQRISDPPIKKCPKCSKRTAQRQISGGSFILKGGGWYADLYSSAKPAKKEEGTSSAEPKAKEAPSGDAGKSDTGKSKDSVAPAKSESTAPKAAVGSSGGDGK
jgi:putative FmdB family regulatory protein